MARRPATTPVARAAGAKNSAATSRLARSDRLRGMDITYTGLDPAGLARTLHEGRDHGGNGIETFTDEEGGWPLRCCLTDSQPGDVLATIAFTPFPWRSPYATTGPVVVHAQGCAGASGAYPEQFDERRQILRPYGADGQQDHALLYDLITLAEPGELRAALEGILADPRVELVQSHNVLAGCYSFTVRRA